MCWNKKSIIMFDLTQIRIYLCEKSPQRYSLPLVWANKKKRASEAAAATELFHPPFLSVPSCGDDSGKKLPKPVRENLAT